MSDCVCGDHHASIAGGPGAVLGPMHASCRALVRPLSWRCASIRLLFGGLSPLLSADSGHWVVLLNSHSRTYTCRYYLATVLPSIALTLSPFHFLWNGIHAVISPAAGHSGWEDHWQSDQHHYIHHATFESNCKSVYPYVCLSCALDRTITTSSACKCVRTTLEH